MSPQNPQPQYPPQYGPPGPMPQPQPPKKKRAWLVPTVVGVVAFGLGSAIGGAGNASTTADPQAPNPTITITETEAGPTETVTAKAPAPKPTSKPKTAATLVEGMNEIGVDAPAGRYKTIVPEDSLNCYWERAKDDKGDFKSIIANENLDPGARGSVTVRKGEFFKSTGCGTWRRVS